MSELDVRELAGESLTEIPFPASSKADFRLYLSPEVHQGISRHAKQDTSVEICGVMVGLWHQDENGPYAIVEDIIRCESATSKFAEVTFTHESWSHINQEMDSKYEEKRIVGWYHSHPDFGIFLSDRDCFIHEHFFSGPGQVAYVVDPVRDLEGAFAWKDGKPTPIGHYWVGNTIHTVEASQSNPAAKAAESGMSAASFAAGDGYGSSGDSGSFSFLTMALAALSLFLLGYLFSGLRSSWERQAIKNGVVAEYTDFKNLKIGLREELAEVEKYLAAAVKELEAMPGPEEELDEEQTEKLNKVRKLLINSLSANRKQLQQIASRYGYSDEERRMLVRVSEQIRAEQLKLLEEMKKQAEAEAADAAESAEPESATDSVKSKQPQDDDKDSGEK